jgi:hypothetical protein
LAATVRALLRSGLTIRDIAELFRAHPREALLSGVASSVIDGRLLTGSPPTPTLADLARGAGYYWLAVNVAH